MLFSGLYIHILRSEINQQKRFLHLAVLIYVAWLRERRKDFLLCHDTKASNKFATLKLQIKSPSRNSSLCLRQILTYIVSRHFTK